LPEQLVRAAIDGVGGLLMGSIRVGWWNLQNLFDTVDDPISADLEFTAAEGWTPPVLEAKLANLAVAINEFHGGQGPELFGVAEVEGDAVFQALLDAVGNPHLKLVEDPQGTSDLRGIDTSLAYDDRKLRVVDKRSHVVHLRYATRDIFEVLFETVDTDERLAVIATHWPSRTKGRWRSEPLRIALAENIAFIVRDHVRFDAQQYLQLKKDGDLAAVQQRWEAKVLIMGDLNDEPADRSLVEHLQASSEIDRVTGPTNEIKAFEKEAIDYRGDDTFLFNASWKFLAPENTGTYFIASTQDESFPNRYQVLDQIIASRGLLHTDSLHLDPDSVHIHDTNTVATQPAKRPRGFDRKTKKGTSDHLPVTALLSY
jgi:endonuclease/exonuclease/phosphatase family metal-dependent hydrolase